MKSKKRLLSFALALGLIGSLIGCGQGQEDSTPSTAETTEPTSFMDRELTAEEQAILQERRDIAEAYMRESLSVLWKTDKNIIYGLATRDNGLKLYLIEGRIYQGVPYAYAVGTQDSFLEYAGEPDKNGVYTISGLEDTAVNYESYGARVGNDCSGVLTNAWSQIGTSFTTSMSGTMHEDYGVIPVGDYNFNPTISPETNRITDTAPVTTGNGPLTMYKAYAQLQKADCVFRQAPGGGNHSMMIVDVNVVYQGDMVDGTKSTVTVLEQSRRNQNQQKRYDHPELGEVFLIGCIDEVYTFAELYGDTYLPVTIREFHDPSPVDEPWIKDSLENPSKDNLFTGNITSNWYIDCVTVTIADEAGKTVQEVTGRARRRFNKDFDMTRFVTENPGACKGSVDLSKLSAGNYKCTVTARLTTGEKITARTFDFTV
ncbi:MAG: hypothetical protein IJO56_02140 [Oscillospiraceae bacterium]|nr:hypothetical protein [Oscillospiraceae bacterium]